MKWYQSVFYFIYNDKAEEIQKAEILFLGCVSTNERCRDWGKQPR
jgi:hypothetical protein